MPVQETDISWQVLRRIVHQWAGAAAELAELKPLVGGCINTTVQLTLKDGKRAVLKISPHRVNRELFREAGQLTMLKGLGLPVPEVYAWHIATLDEPDSYLLMEFVEGVNLSAAKSQCTPQQYDQLQQHLAELVLQLHSHTAEEYHRADSEDCQKFTSWPAFYRHVYDPIWQEVEKLPAITPKLRKQICACTGGWRSCWRTMIGRGWCTGTSGSTNLLAKADEQGKWRISALLDPNCKYAPRGGGDRVPGAVPHDHAGIPECLPAAAETQ